MEYGIAKKADRGAWISIFAYLFLSTLKVWMSFITNSEALRADGLNNFTDILASVAVLVGLKLSRKPRDSDHPYGHSRVEQISSLVASFIMVTVGLQVLLGAFTSIREGNEVVPDALAAWVALFSAAVMYGVYRYNIRLAQKVNSTALHAAAKDNLSDVLVSIGAIIGIVGSQLGLPILDPLAAFAVGIMICKTAWEIFYESTHMLTDGFEPELLSSYGQTIKNIDGVQNIVDLRARKYGNQISVDVVVEVDGNLSVERSHCIADCIEQQLQDVHSVAYSHVHIEPKKVEST